MKYRIRPEYYGSSARFDIYSVYQQAVYTPRGLFGVHVSYQEIERHVTSVKSMAEAEEIVKHLCSEVKEIECSQSQ